MKRKVRFSISLSAGVCGSLAVISYGIAAGMWINAVCTVYPLAKFAMDDYLVDYANGEEAGTELQDRIFEMYFSKLLY